jgi:predicted Zn-dependent protease
LAGAVAVLALAGCAINPVSKRPEPVLTTVKGETTIGRTETDKLREEVGFVEDVAAADYVRRVGARLAAQSPRAGIDYHFHIVDMEEPNAFALPGGYVFVSRGLLALVNSEAELANVIAHEIGHVAARHAVQRASLSAPFAIASGLGEFAVGLVSRRLGALVGGVGGLAGSLVVSPYSRRQEREADRIGQEMAAAAGWEPSAMTALLETLERDEVFHTGSVREGTFLDSHPTTPERVRQTAKNAATLSVVAAPPLAAGRRAFLNELDGVRIGPNPAEGIFVDGRFLHPVMNFALTFPANWQTQNAPQFVAGRPRTGRALVVLQLAEESADLAAAAAAFAKKAGVSLDAEVERTRIHGLSALRATAQRRDAAFDLTWIAYGDGIYEIVAAAQPERFAAMRPTLAGIARSFGPLTAADRGAIEDVRLRVVEVPAHETLDALLGRVDSGWKAEMALLANGMTSARDVTAGDVLKLPLPEPWVGESPSAP